MSKLIRCALVVIATWTTLSVESSIGQELKNVKVNALEKHLNESLRKSGKPIPPRLILNKKVEIGDVGIIGGDEKPNPEAITSSYTVTLQKRLSPTSGIVELKCTTKIPKRPISAVGRPGNLKTTYAPAQTTTELFVFILDRIDLSLKADGSELPLRGLFFVSSVRQQNEKDQTSPTLFVVEPYNPQNGGNLK